MDSYKNFQRKSHDMITIYDICLGISLQAIKKT